VRARIHLPDEKTHEDEVRVAAQLAETQNHDLDDGGVRPRVLEVQTEKTHKHRGRIFHNRTLSDKPVDRHHCLFLEIVVYLCGLRQRVRPMCAGDPTHLAFVLGELGVDDINLLRLELEQRLALELRVLATADEERLEDSVCAAARERRVLELDARLHRVGVIIQVCAQ
jgi:hypothetical protein